jgi:hypothetical protein
VIIADTRSPMVVANFAAAAGCAFDFDLISDFCSRSGQLSDGVAATPLNVARSAWQYGVAFTPLNLAHQRLDTAPPRLGRS